MRAMSSPRLGLKTDSSSSSMSPSTSRATVTYSSTIRSAIA